MIKFAFIKFCNVFILDKKNEKMNSFWVVFAYIFCQGQILQERQIFISFKKISLNIMRNFDPERKFRQKTVKKTNQLNAYLFHPF